MGKPGRRAAAKPSLATRIQTDPVYQAVIRLVGYLGTAYPIDQDTAKRLDQAFGKDKVMAAAAELLDFDADAKLARLKPGVRRLSVAVIGPAPEEWETFYQGVENPPPSPYRKDMHTMGQAVAEAIEDATGHKCEARAHDGNADSHVIALERPASPATADDLRWTDPKRYCFQKTDKELVELIHTIQYELAKCDPRSISFREALREIGLVVSELQRRSRASAAKDRCR